MNEAATRLLKPETGKEPFGGSETHLKLYGEPNAVNAYELRDFLQRSVVRYEWIELKDDAAVQALLGLPELRNLPLPLVELPDGRRLFAPTVAELAQQLGWVTQPRLREYDLSIYGAGPAGLSAAVYAASEGLSTVLIERHAIGGQAGSSSSIENYLGFPQGISGAELAERARQQAAKFGVDMLMMREGIKAEFKDRRIYVNMADGSQLVARANLCATGVEYRRLDLPREGELLGKGLYYGAGAAEAPYCANQVVYVVGGANSAGQAVMHFADYAARVVMLVRSGNLADSMSAYLSERVLSKPNVDVRFHTAVSGLVGEEYLQAIQVKNLLTEREETLEASRLFVCIGGNPNTEWAKDTAILRDAAGYLITGSDLLKEGKLPAGWTLKRAPHFLETSVPGSFAAGDVRHGSTKRAAAAVGEGAMAITFVHRYLRESESGPLNP